jgi:hypothetical protein
VVGNVTVQRYLRINGDPVNYASQSWRDISSPVQTTIFDLMNPAKASGLYLPITGSFSGASSVSGASGPSMYTYAENTTTDTNADGVVDLDDGWTAFPTATSDAFGVGTNIVGKGYSIFIFGSDPPVSTNGNAKFDLTGTINSGSYNLPVSYTPLRSATTSNDGWNLVGNPYPSAIDWNAASGWTKTNIGNSIYIDDYQYGTGIFATYSAGTKTWTNAPSGSPYTPAGSAQGYIAMGQGFWVQATGTTPTLTATEAVKVAGQSTYVFKESAPVKAIRVALISSDLLRDESVVCFLDSATSAYDSKFDARKLNNQYGYFNLASISKDGERYAINAKPFATCSDTVMFDVSDVNSGNYFLKFSDFDALPNAMSINLKDNLNNTLIDVRQNPIYNFSVDVNNLASYGSHRFSLMFNYSSTAPSLVAQGQNICDPSLANVVIKNSSTDFSYSILSSVNGSVVNSSTGNGGDLMISVPSLNVLEGVNQYQVKETNNYCNSITAAGSVSFKYITIPSAPLAFSSLSCGAGPVSLSASGAPSDGYYNWYDSLNSTSPYPNQTANFNTESLQKDKTYYVAAVNSLGCEGSRSPISTNIIILSPASITVSDLNTLQSNYATGNQWYLNGNLIAGAASQTLSITQSGVYKVVVSSQGCTTSVEKQLIVTGIENNSTDVKVFPNPLTSNKMLSIEVSGNKKVSASIYNTLGVFINSITFADYDSKQIATYDLGSQSNGVFYLMVNQGNVVRVVRIVKE